MVEVITLLGKKNLDFSIYCLQSFITHCQEKIALRIFDDGSLSDAEYRQLYQQIPSCTIISKNKRDEDFQSFYERFPLCMAFRNENVLALKLVDLLLYNTSSTIFIDSDVLFFKNFNLPVFSNPTFIKDIQNAYIFHPLRLSKYFITWPFINTGFFYFPADENYAYMNFLEEVLANQFISIDTKRLPMWAEQSLWALIAGKFQSISYFDSTQIGMANTKIKERLPVGLHLVSLYRNQFNYYKKNCGLNNESPVVLKLLNSGKKLSPAAYSVERSLNKLNRFLNK